MAGQASVNLKRIAEALLASHLVDTQGEIHPNMIRAYVEARAYGGLVAPGEVDGLCDTIDELMTDAAQEGRITVTIRED
jgi:hypothetical protein